MSCTLADFLHWSITMQHSPMLISFSALWVELRVQIKGESPAGHLLLVLCTCSCGEKPSRIFWNDIKICSQDHIKTYNGQSTMYPSFYWIFAKLLPGKNSDKILCFLHSRPIFYAVRLYVMTKTNGRCLKEWSLALFAMMGQNFIWTWWTLM